MLHGPITSNISKLPVALGGMMCAEKDGKIFIAGGDKGVSDYSDAIYEYDIELDTYTHVATMSFPGYYSTATIWNNMFVFGAIRTSGPSKRTSQVFAMSIADYSIIELGELPISPEGENQQFVTYNDELHYWWANEMLKYNESSRTWTVISEKSSTECCGYGTIIDDEYWIAGKWDNSNAVAICYNFTSNKIEVYDVPGIVYDCNIVSIHNEIYIINGREYNVKLNKSVYKYNRELDIFEKTSIVNDNPLFAASVIKYNEGHIVIGGCTVVPDWKTMTDDVYKIEHWDDSYNPDKTLSPGVKLFNANYNKVDKTVTLTWENPVESDNFAGVKLLRKLNNYSTDENDGEVVLETNESNVMSFVDDVSFDTTYYYTIYTFNPDGKCGNPRRVVVDTTRLEFMFPKQFTTAGAVGNVGPTESQIEIAYNNTTLDKLVTSYNGIQEWTVPKKGLYNIKATGASGGDQGDSNKPGKGAIISGDVLLDKGDRLFIVVGQEGTATGSDIDGGGGGGTFIVKEDLNSTDLLSFGGDTPRRYYVYYSVIANGSEYCYTFVRNDANSTIIRNAKTYIKLSGEDWVERTEDSGKDWTITPSDKVTMIETNSKSFYDSSISNYNATWTNSLSSRNPGSTVITTVSPLIIAGGGSGEGEDSMGSDASLTEDSSGSPLNPDKGYGANIGNGAGGGGYRSGGKTGPSDAIGGTGFLQGANGGTGKYGTGGFGGGAGGFDNAGAGGGGYTGGVANDTNGNGGGGSFVQDDIVNVTRSIRSSFGHGEVIITGIQLEQSIYLATDVDGNMYVYNDDTGEWVNQCSGFNVSLFDDCDDTIQFSTVKKLNDNCKLIKATDDVKESITYTTVALPNVSIIKQQVDFNLTDKTIVGLDIDATDEVQMLVSIDEGSNWKYYNDENWVDYNDDMTGTLISTVNKISKNTWMLLNYSNTNKLRFAFIVNATVYSPVEKIKGIVVKTINR